MHDNVCPINNQVGTNEAPTKNKKEQKVDAHTWEVSIRNERNQMHICNINFIDKFVPADKF